MRLSATSLPKGTPALTLGSLGYLLIIGLLTGLRVEHLIIVLGINILFHISAATRKFILGLSIFALFGMIYDVMRAFPNYNFNVVDIEGLYLLEMRLFGIPADGRWLTPNEYFSLYNSGTGDFLSGFFYINWMPVPIAFAIWLFFSDKNTFLHFSLTFLFVNLIGFSIYYIHPAAPPWYVDMYGFDLIPGTPGSPAGLSRFDQLIGFGLFDSIYSKNANIFAAMPSLHSAYPVVVFYYALKAGRPWMKWASVLFMAGIWFAAVYSGHHYLLDVIAGILCAVAGILLYRYLLEPSRWYTSFIRKYSALIS